MRSLLYHAMYHNFYVRHETKSLCGNNLLETPSGIITDASKTQPLVIAYALDH
jgi:hypothetical protein